MRDLATSSKGPLWSSIHKATSSKKTSIALLNLLEVLSNKEVYRSNLDSEAIVGLNERLRDLFKGTFLKQPLWKKLFEVTSLKQLPQSYLFKVTVGLLEFLRGQEIKHSHTVSNLEVYRNNSDPEAIVGLNMGLGDLFERTSLTQPLWSNLFEATSLKQLLRSDLRSSTARGPEGSRNHTASNSEVYRSNLNSEAIDPSGLLVDGCHFKAVPLWRLLQRGCFKEVLSKRSHI